MDVDKALVPIFIETDVPRNIVQIGTGVFLDFHGNPFLFTAAHVSDEQKNGRLLVPTINGLEEIEGYLAYLDLPPEVLRSSDHIDIAYYKLSVDFARALSYHFFPLLEKMEIIESSLNLSMLSVVGYPASKGKRKINKFTSDLFYYRGVAADLEEYVKQGLSPEENIMIHFHKKNALDPDTGKRKDPPSPRGVSGGAIFAWPRDSEFSRDWSLPVLVGVLHTYKEKEGLFIGTNLIPFLAAITLGEMKGFDVA